MSTTAIPFVQAGRTSRPAAQPRSRSFLAAFLDTLSLCLARRLQRNALANLAEDKHLLADIGLTREQALREAGKPFWQ